MKFTPIVGANSCEIAPEGEYSAIIDSAKEATSKKGNSMITLKLSVTTSDGVKVTVHDYLVATEAAAWRIEQFCRAADLVNQWEAGDLDPLDCEGQEVRVLLRIEETAQYGERNRIEAYLADE